MTIDITNFLIGFAAINFIVLMIAVIVKNILPFATTKEIAPYQAIDEEIRKQLKETDDENTD